MKPEEIGTNLEKYDFEFFMNEAMNYVPNDIDIREGSIMYDALAPACYQLATLAMELKNMMLETFVVSATGGYLDLRAEEAGVARIKATYAVVTATITSSDGSPLNLESGSRFSSIGEHPVYYKVTEKLTDGKYHLTAEIPGMAGNEYIGTILPLDNLNDFGICRTMELFNLNRGITNLVIGDKSLMTDFTLTKTIDDSANAVKILREDKEKGKREIYSATNAKNIEKWGKLQVVETISDADLNASQLKARANELLRKKNVEIISADIDAIGDLSIRAGKSFTWRNSKTTEYGVGHDTLVLVTRCVHTISQTPTMSLEVEVIG